VIEDDDPGIRALAGTEPSTFAEIDFKHWIVARQRAILASAAN
jgi:hypothetical protein